MGLQFEVDNIDSLDDGIKSLYKEHNGKFRLEVEGIDPADELKSALQKERDNNKLFSQELKELKKIADEASKKALEEQGNYKELSEKFHNEKVEAQKNYNDLLSQINSAKSDDMVRKFAESMTNDATEQKIIAKFAKDYVQIENNEVSFSKDVSDIESELSVFVQNKAKGSNDNGNNRHNGDTKTATREQFEGMNHKQRADFVKDGGKVIE